MSMSFRSLGLTTFEMATAGLPSEFKDKTVEEVRLMMVTVLVVIVVMVILCDQLLIFLICMMFLFCMVGHSTYCIRPIL